MKKIRMGIIGMGAISGFHIDGIRASPDAELVCLCDINKNVLEEKAERYNVPDTCCFSDYHDLLACGYSHDMLWGLVRPGKGIPPAACTIWIRIGSNAKLF